MTRAERFKMNMIDEFKQMCEIVEKDGIIIEYKSRMLKALEKDTEWIFVTERLPEKSGDYLCIFGGTKLVGSDYYTTESDAKKIFDEPEEYVGWRSQNVVAWMPLPKP